jgi:adenylate cyclase class IV
MEGVQIHLDTVDGLGKFIEFEKAVSGDAERQAGRAQLEALGRYFQIDPDDLMASSYSDLLGTG